MYSEEMETLIEAALVNGQLDDRKKAALIKRAQSEGIDLNELEIYMESILAKRKQSKDAVEDAKEEVRLQKIEKKKGRTCPYCGEPIPALAETCPVCGKLILTAAVNEKIEKKISEVSELLSKAAKLLHERPDFMAAITAAKQKCTELKMYYSSVEKVVIFTADAEKRITEIEKQYKSLWTKVTIYLILLFGSLLGYGIYCAITF